MVSTCSRGQNIAYFMRVNGEFSGLNDLRTLALWMHSTDAPTAQRFDPFNAIVGDVEAYEHLSSHLPRPRWYTPIRTANT